MTNEEAIRIAQGLITDFKCESETMVEFCNAVIKALKQQPCEDWHDVPSDEMTLEQARQAVKDLRKKLAEHLEQEPCVVHIKDLSDDEIKKFEEVMKNVTVQVIPKEPCGDLISRQEVIEVIKNYASMLWKKYYEPFPESTIMEIIQALPPVTVQYYEDAISRQATVKRLCKVGDFMNEKRSGSGSPYITAALFIQDNKDEFPPVTPKEKTGHWIVSRTFPTKVGDEHLNEYKCSSCYRGIRCTESQLVNYPYCHCGARMVEPQESEEV